MTIETVSFRQNEVNGGIPMADNYLEKKYEELQARKVKEQRARQIAWKKRMDAYRKKMEDKK